MMKFKHRLDAGRRVAQALSAYRGKNPLVLAIPRGGVPLGRAIADALGGDLDVVLVHKLGSPGNPEYAVGSISEDGRIELGPDGREPFVNPDEMEAVIRDEARALRRRRAQYTPIRTPIDPAGRTVIVVDDGLATGFTMMAALKSIRARNPARLVAAVPVSPEDTLARVRELADETVCLLVPEFFGAVGRFYENFDPVEDEQVVEDLKDSGRLRQKPA